MKLLPLFEVNNYASGDIKLPNNFWSFTLKVYAWLLYNNNELVVTFGLDPNIIPSHNTVLERVKILKRQFTNSRIYIEKTFDNFTKCVYGSVRQFSNKKVYWCFIFPIFNKEIKLNVDKFINIVFKLKFSVIEGFHIQDTDIEKLNVCVNNFSEPYDFLFDDSSYITDEENQIKYISHIYIHGYRFVEEILILLYVYFELFNLLVDQKQRTDISVFHIVKKVMLKINHSFLLNDSQIQDKIKALTRSFSDHLNLNISEIINNIMIFFESTDLRRNRLELVTNALNSIGNSRKYSKYFVINESLHGRKRLKDDVFQVLKQSIDNRKKNNIFNLEYMCNPKLVAPFDANKIDRSIFDCNYLSYDVDYFNFFMKIEDIPQIVGHKWEASCVITPNKLHNDYPKIDSYKKKQLHWPEIEMFTNDNVKFICLSQNPVLYCPSRNCFINENLNRNDNIDPLITSESEHSDSDHHSDNVNNNALIDHSIHDSDHDDDSSSVAEETVTNQQVIIANNDPEDPINFYFHELFNKYDSQVIHSGHAYNNSNLGDSNRLLYTNKCLYDPNDLVQFLTLYTKIRYVKVLWYGTKAKSHARYDDIIKRANDSMDAANVNIAKIENNSFDIAINYTINGILLFQKVFNDDIDKIIEDSDGVKYKLEAVRSGVSLIYYQILNGLGYSVTIKFGDKASKEYSNITKIKFYPHVIAEIKGNFSGKFGDRKSLVKLNDHYKLLCNLFEYLKHNTNKINNYRVEFSIKARTVEEAKLIAFKYCNESNLSALFGRAGREYRYFVLPISKYLENIKLLLNIVRNNGLSSSSKDFSRLEYQNYVLHDVYNGFGMNHSFREVNTNTSFYLNNIYDDSAWFNKLTDANGSTLNMGTFAEANRIIPVAESSSYIIDDNDGIDDNDRIDDDRLVVGLVANDEFHGEEVNNGQNLNEIIEYNSEKRQDFLDNFDVNSLYDPAVYDDPRNIQDKIDQIKSRVVTFSVRPNFFQFRYISSGFSDTFTNINKLCEFILLSFGNNYENSVITKKRIEEKDIVEVDTVFPADIIDEIMTKVQCSSNNKGWRYYFKSNLICTSIIADSHENLAKRIYQQWGDQWIDHCKLLRVQTLPAAVIVDPVVAVATDNVTANDIEVSTSTITAASSSIPNVVNAVIPNTANNGGNIIKHRNKRSLGSPNVLDNDENSNINAIKKIRSGEQGRL